MDYRERLHYIDVARGIGILLVCLGHAISIENNHLNMFILSFHMPLFFFISGYLFCGKGDQTNQTYSFVQFIRRKISALIVPQLLCGMLGYGRNYIFHILLNKEKPVFHVTGLLSWFLFVLFLMEIVMWCITAYLKHNGICVSLLCAVLLFTVFVPFLKRSEINIFTQIPFLKTTVEQTIVAVIFGISGMLVKPAINWWHKNGKYGSGGVILYALVCVLCEYNAPIKLYVNEYGNRYIFLVTAFIGIAATLDCAMMMEKSAYLQFLGKNSVIIYVNQFTVIAIFLGISKVLFGVETGHYPEYFIVFLFTMLMQFPIIYLARCCFPFFFGLPYRRKSKVK